MQKNNVRSTNEVDHHIGQCLRTRRIEIGLSQKQLAAKIGISFQQLQKYENGFNRISASRLYLVAKVIGVSLMHFFTDCEKTGEKTGDKTTPSYQMAESKTGYRAGTPEKDRASQRENLELSRCYFSINDKATRRRLLAIMRLLARVPD